MNKFVSAVIENLNEAEARTDNNMKARATTADKNVDLFYKIGASRGKNIIPAFVAALAEDRELALRIALWVRDVRGGAGERQLFRDVLVHLENSDPVACLALMKKVPELGRWDDLLVIKNDKSLMENGYKLIKNALMHGDGLCAKWMPRKGEDAARLRTYLKMSPKQYRKTLVGLTQVVETAMCAKQWDTINFEHVPSLAAARYQKAFLRNSKKYAEYKLALTKGEVKINASAVFPYDVLKSVRKGDAAVADAQWASLPNYMDDQKILALVDVSGSMCTAIGTSTAMDIAMSIGLYVADKNVGPFKDTFLTFSGSPQLLHLKGTLSQKMHQMQSSTWAMNTDLHKAFDKILSTAVEGKVPEKDMPSILLILSDMQFDQCVHFDDTAHQMIKRKYAAAGYKVPNVVFWNINSHDNVPVKFNAKGVALVSGFSPAIMKSILSGKEYTPIAMMLETVMVERYNPFPAVKRAKKIVTKTSGVEKLVKKATRKAAKK